MDGAGCLSRAGKPDLRTLRQEVAGTARVRCRSLFTFVDGDCGWNHVGYSDTPNAEYAVPWTFRTSLPWRRSSGEWLCNGVLRYFA